MATMETKIRQKTFGLDIADSHQNEKWARELVVKKYNCDSYRSSNKFKDLCRIFLKNQ